MLKIREILRLGLERQKSFREIKASCSVSMGTVSKYLALAKGAALTYEQIKKLSDGELRQCLMLSSSGKSAPEEPFSRPLPDWSHINKELRKKGVTLQLLWEEYKESHPDGYQTSQFYEQYNRWRGKLRVTLRQSHKAGEKLFVDYAGQTIGVKCRTTGQIKQAQLFVAVLGASNYTYAECTWTQGLADWIGSHVRSFDFFGGVPHILVPDNLKSGVTKVCRYEPDINPTYHDMSTHYGTAIIPARARKPRDKAKVEAGVLLAERWILAVLRNRVFFSLVAVNRAISELLIKLNNKPFQKLPGSRQSCFDTLESKAMLPLPPTQYVFAEWKKVRANT